jgi:hypothetical protein
MRPHWVLSFLVAGCGFEPSDGAGPGPGPGTNPDPPSNRVEITFDHLQPGWLVTTSRLTAHEPPTEITQVSDGTPLTLTGTASDVFIATITDGDGALIALRAMHAPCTMAASRQLRVPHEYLTIQEAIEAASPGDTVKVAHGTYTESIVMRPGICLLGAGAKHTILDAGHEPRSLVDLSDAPGSVVAGFTIKNGAQGTGCARPLDPFGCSGDWYRGGIYLGGQTWEDPTQDAPPIIANNLFVGNDVGVFLYWRAFAVVRNNVFLTNRIGLVANHFQSRALVANNVFLDNTDLAIGNQAAYLDIIDNVIVGSELGILFQYVQTGHIRCNLFHANGAIQADLHLVPPRFAIGADGNLEGEPRFLGNGDYRLHPSSPGKDGGCHDTAREPDGTRPDLGAYGGPLAAWIEL